MTRSMRLLVLFLIGTAMGDHHMRQDEDAGSGHMEDIDHIIDNALGHLHHSEANEECMHDREANFAEQVDLVRSYLDVDHIVGGSIVATKDDMTIIKTIWQPADESQSPYVKYLGVDHEYKVTDESETEEFKYEVEEEEVYVRLDVDAGELHIFIHNKTVNCSYIVDVTEYHAEVLTHPVYDSFALSPDKRRIVYMAEGLMMETNETWRKNAFTVADAINPKIVIVDLYNQEVRTLSLPSDQMPGKSTWTPDGTGIVTVIRPRMYTPCAECTDNPTRLAYIDLDDPNPQFWFLTAEDKRVSTPIFTSEKMIYFSNYLINRGVPAMENEPQNLESIAFPFEAEPTPVVIVSSHLRKDNFHGLYPDRLNPWFGGQYLESPDYLVVNTLYWQGYRPVFIYKSGEVQILNRLMKVLDMKDNLILGLSDDVNGYALFLGNLLELPPATTPDPNMIKWNSTLADPCKDLLDSLFHGATTPNYYSTTKTTSSQGTSMPTTTANPETTTMWDDMTAVEREGDFHPIMNETDNTSVDVDEKTNGVLYTTGDSDDRLVVLFSAFTNQDFYNKMKLTRFFLKLNWDVLHVEYLGQLHGQILTTPVDEAHKFIKSVAKDYESTLLAGKELDGSLAILLAALHSEDYDQVAVTDGIMLLSTTLLYQPRLYSRLIGKPFPGKPSPSQVVTLWRHSPLSVTKNYTATTLVFSSEKWPKQSERFVERVDKEGHAILEFWNETSGISFEKSSLDIMQYTVKFFQTMGGYEASWCGEATTSHDMSPTTTTTGSPDSSVESSSSHEQSNNPHPGGQVSSTHAVTIDSGSQEAHTSNSEHPQTPTGSTDQPTSATHHPTTTSDKKSGGGKNGADGFSKAGLRLPVVLAAVFSLSLFYVL